MLNKIKIYHCRNKCENGTYNNLGDDLGPYFYEKIFKVKYTYGIPSDNPTTDDIYMLCGSILELSKQNCILYSVGLNNNYQSTDNIKNIKYKRIISVRGKLTRDVLIANNIKCPKIYGDSGLLLRYVYNPTITKKYKYGIIPHVNQITDLVNKVISNPNIKIIYLNSGNIENIINDILSCEKILSCSLHGCVVAHAYNIPVIPLQLGNLMSEFKFLDHYSSLKIYADKVRINISDIKHIDTNFIENLFHDNTHLLINDIDKIIDLDFLWKIFPLNTNKYVKIAFLSDKIVHTSSMELDFYNQYLECRKNSNTFNGQYLGNKIDELNTLVNYNLEYNRPICEQIEEIYGDKYFFDIICSLPGGGLYDVSYYTGSGKTKTLIHFHETFDDIAKKVLDKIQKAYGATFDLIIFKCQNEQKYYDEHYPYLFEKSIITNVPQFACYKYINTTYQKDIEIGLFGNTTPSIYPFRYKLFTLIMKKFDKKAQRYHHKMQTYTKEQILLENKGVGDSERQESVYIDFVKRSKIAICTASKYDYFLKKYSEAALCKCLIIGNIPTQYKTELTGKIIDVSGMDDSKIINTINYWLTHDAERHAHVNKVYSYFLENFSMNNQLLTYKKAAELYDNKFKIKDIL